MIGLAGLLIGAFPRLAIFPPRVDRRTTGGGPSVPVAGIAA
ncbi:MAG TPA: hypothetical protein VGV57_06700 [Thermoleophilaceae bacterium]|nr:hypothetical protein [Thermoleophilaceae bacterium]